MNKELKKALEELEGKHVSTDVTGAISGIRHFDSFEWWLEHNNGDELVFSSSAQEQYLHIKVSEITNIICNKILELYHVIIQLKCGMVVQVYNC